MLNVCMIEKQKKTTGLKPRHSSISAGGDLRAVFPIVAELADQIKRASDENGVFRRGFCEGVFEGALGVGDYGKMGGMVASDFRELRGGNGARGSGRGENDFCGAREKKAGDFVDGFVPKGGVDQEDFAAGEILFEEIGEFAGSAGIVRAIAINVRRGLQFFETAGPDGVGDPLGNGFIGNSKIALLEKARGGDGVQRVLELETSGKAWGDFEDFAGVDFDDA